MKKFQILGFFITFISLSILKISSKSETWSPEPVRFAMEHAIYICIYLFQNLINGLNYLHPEKIFLDSNTISLNQSNLCIAIWPKKSLFNLKKFLVCFL